MAELTAEIVARFDQVQRELAKTAKETDLVEKKMKAAAKAAEFFDKSLSDIEKNAGKAADGVEDLGNKSKGATDAVEDLGKGLSKDAAGGLDDVIESALTLSTVLGPAGRIAIGLLASSAAFIAFKDDIVDAFFSIQKVTDETREGLEAIFKVIENVDRSTILLEGFLQPALEDQRKLVEDLANQIKEKFGDEGFANILPGVRLPEFLIPLDDLEIRFARANELLRQLEEEKQKIDNKDTARTTTQENAAIALQEAQLESIRLDIERAGFKEEAVKLTREELAALIDHRDLLEFIEKLGKSRTGSTRERKTLLEQTEDLNKRLKEQLEGLRNIDTSRLGQLSSQNDQLREQIKIVERLNAVRAAGGGSLGISGLNKIGGGLSSDNAVTPLGELIGDINNREKDRKKNLLALPVGLDPDLLDEATAAQDRQTEAMARAQSQAEDLANSIAGGLTDAISSFAEAIGSGEDPFAALRQSIGSFAIDMGRTVIGFSIAGDAIKTFIQSAPGVGIVAGAGLIALGAALKKSAQNKLSSFAGTGAVSASTAGLIADPRQGRDGRFRRDPIQSESGYQPISSLTNFSIPEFTFKLQGEDFVAGTDKNVQRQTRTRGTSPVRSTGARSTSR